MQTTVIRDAYKFSENFRDTGTDILTHETHSRVTFQGIVFDMYRTTQVCVLRDGYTAKSIVRSVYHDVNGTWTGEPASFFYRWRHDI